MERFHYRFTRRPAFLGAGFMRWHQHGYAHTAKPDIDLLNSAVLRSNDPWVRFAAILEHAKRGDRTHLCDLEPIIRDRSIDPTLTGAALELLADAGGRRELELLASMMLDGPRHLKLEVVNAVHWSGVLWLIPFMANVLEECPRHADRESVEAAISGLLDPREGDLEFFGKDQSPREYSERVQARIDELSAAAGTDEATVLDGEIVDMNALIQRMHARLLDPSLRHWTGFLAIRHRFEAYTGANCSSFYRDGDLQPIRARKVIERFLAANPQARFIPGHRYFFMRDLFGAA